MSTGRDNFSEKTKKLLADRVGWYCSFPSCGQGTLGPSNVNPEQRINNGIAAHISAASENGPRYNSLMTPEERKHADNGIWMCRNHGNLIDADFDNYSVATLKQWKLSAENRAYEQLSKPNHPHLSSLDVNRAPPIEAQLQLMAPPRASKHFFGRQDELSTLINALQSEPSILISGIGGIGKSEFLLQALKQLETDKTVIWCSIDKYHSVETLTLALRQVFSVQGVPCSTDNLPLHFDKLKACIVFDGLEQSNLDNLEELEDLIKEWHFATNITQFVMTSQVTLYSFPGQTTIQLKGLDEVASRSLFNQSYGDDSLVKDKGIDDLLQFCDGHALAITISSALTKHYGNADNALKFINKKTTQHLGLPERRRHNRHTSLEICLQIAYDSLPENPRQLLWALSETPAGVCTQFFDKQWLEIKDTSEAYASLNRWHFVNNIKNNENKTITRVLTPIRNFVIERVKKEDPESYERIIKLLALHLQLHVAALEEYFDTPEDTPHLLNEYNAIHPNLINVIELALARENDKVLGDIAGSLASAMMPYYFVLGAPEVGAKILKALAELALKTNNILGANDLAQQFMSLAVRAGNKASFTEGQELIKSIELAAEGLDIAPELSMSKAISLSHDSLLTEQHARVAITGFKTKLQNRVEKLRKDKIEDDELILKISPLIDEISHAFSLLGTALLNQNKIPKALKAYSQSLEYQMGSSSGVNQGQTLHQLGKCESKLGNYKSAIEHFSEAAGIFFYVGMKDYLSHSFAEIGYNLLDVDLPELQKQFTEAGVSAALLDLMQYTIQKFNTSLTPEYQEYMYVFRKLTGTFYFLSLIGYGNKLGTFVHDLAQKTTIPMMEHLNSGPREASVRHPLHMLSTILKLGKHIELVEIDLADNNNVELDTMLALLNVISEVDFFMKSMRVTDWLDVYVTRRLEIKEDDSHDLKELIWSYYDDFNSDMW
jgi:tetratricopeptide (TPR) repeat protein